VEQSTLENSRGKASLNRKRSHLLLRITAGVIVASVVASIMAIMLFPQGMLLLFPVGAEGTPPSDEAILAAFRNNSDVLEKLAHMAINDFPKQPFMEGETGLPSVRLREYHNSIERIWPGAYVVSDPGGIVKFIVAESDGALAAIRPEWRKGIEYISGEYEEKEGIILKNLNGAEKLPAGDYLRQIKPHWFIMFERTD